MSSVSSVHCHQHIRYLLRWARHLFSLNSIAAAAAAAAQQIIAGNKYQHSLQSIIWILTTFLRRSSFFRHHYSHRQARDKATNHTMVLIVYHELHGLGSKHGLIHKTKAFSINFTILDRTTTEKYQRRREWDMNGIQSTEWYSYEYGQLSTMQMENLYEKSASIRSYTVVMVHDAESGECEHFFQFRNAVMADHTRALFHHCESNFNTSSEGPWKLSITDLFVFYWKCDYNPWNSWKWKNVFELAPRSIVFKAPIEWA